jgi:C1A family cysteine protease
MSNEVLSQLRAGNPVIIFLNLDSNMQNWMQALVDWPNVDLEADAVQLPALGPKMPYVGHVVVAVGYVAASRNFIMRNSFGFGWGVGGRFTIALDDMNSTVCQSAVSLISVK